MADRFGGRARDEEYLVRKEEAEAGRCPVAPFKDLIPP
jgi:hypothetical protein